MGGEKIFVDSFRSSEDQSLYKIYCQIDMSESAKPQWVPCIPLTEFIKSGAIIGHIKYSAGQPISVQAPFSGTIEEILDLSTTNKRGNLFQIVTLRRCQHFPKAKNQGPTTDQNIPQFKSILQTADTCQYCDQQIWSYYEKQEHEVTLEKIKRNFDNFNIEQFEWKVVLSQQFTKNTEIGATDDESYFISNSGKISYLIPSLKSPNISLDTVVLKYKKVVCKHEKITSGFCVFCLTDTKSMKGSDFRRYLFQFDIDNYNPSIILGGSALDDQAHQFKQKLLKNKKALLILDLDNTILHSVSLKRVSEQSQKQIIDFAIIPPEEGNIYIQRTIVKFRPGFEYFLRKVVDIYEIFVYTKGTRIYAEEVCRAVKSKYADILEGTRNFLPHRIVSRDQDPNLSRKSLDFIIPKTRDFMLILDDRRDVWNHSPLCVFTRPFLYFYSIRTEDGKTKLEPVQWQKGGGSLEHKPNQLEKKKMEEIIVAQEYHLKQVVAQKVEELQEQIIKETQKQKSNAKSIVEENMLILVDQNANSNTNKENNPIKSTKPNSPVKTLESQQMFCNSSAPDEYLISTAFALKQAHSIYFSKMEQPDDEGKKEGKFADLGYSFQQYKKSNLDHLSAYFLAKDYKKTGAYRRAQKLGLRIAENMHQKINILIRPNNFGQGFPQNSSDLAQKYYQESLQKMKKICQAKNIPIISQTWIDACYEFNCCLKYVYFEAEDSYAKQIFSTDIKLNSAISDATTEVGQFIKSILDNDNSDLIANK